jgi:hypothetical protein
MLRVIFAPLRPGARARPSRGGASNEVRGRVAPSLAPKGVFRAEGSGFFNPALHRSHHWLPGAAAVVSELSRRPAGMPDRPEGLISLRSAPTV